MSDEAGFLHAIQENLEDDTARLAYADWLEERGDIRGEYLRLEHQLAQISLRLGQLREQIDQDWLRNVSKRLQVVLVSYPPGLKAMVIKLVREITGKSLMDCKMLSECVRGVIKDDLTRAEAEQLAKKFEGFAVVAVEQATAK